MKLKSWMIAGGAMFAVSCGNKAKEETATGDLSKVTSLKELGTADALNITLPESLTNAGTALGLSAFALDGTKKSSDACRLTEAIKQSVSQIKNVSSFLCHLEVESSKIPFGQKTRIMLNESQEFARIWVDNSQEGKIIIYMYKDGALRERIELSGKNETGVIGTIHTRGSEDSYSWAGEISFDAGYTTAGLTTIADKSINSSEFDNQENEFKRKISLSLFEDGLGISTAELASSGTWSNQAFSDRGLALVGSEYGSVMMNSIGSHQSQNYDFTRRSHFNAEGYAVASTVSQSFASGGDLFIERSRLPEFLASDFAPAAPEGSDGSYDVTVTLNPDSAEHAACDGDRDGDHADCWGSDFEFGENVE